MAASTVFAGYPPTLAADGDLTTSWFGTGPEGAGLPTVFTWTAASPVCVTEITIFGNGMQANAGFQEDYGFGSVTISVLDETDDVLFEESHGLDGTPDPTVTSQTGGLLATRVQLELYDHESSEAGGFAELEVIGAKP